MSGTAPPISGLTIERPHRADARRNYDALLAAARVAFAERGTDVPLEDVARDAGVGIGTLYRNFPTRQNLLEAILVGEIEELHKAAHDALEEEPWDAFEIWLRRFAGYVTTKMAIMQAMDKGTPLFRACKSAMHDAGEMLFDRAVDAGCIRDGVQLDDVLPMIAGVTTSHYANDEQRERVFQLTLGAIRAA